MSSICNAFKMKICAQKNLYMQSKYSNVQIYKVCFYVYFTLFPWNKLLSILLLFLIWWTQLIAQQWLFNNFATWLGKHSINVIDRDFPILFLVLSLTTTCTMANYNHLYLCVPHQMFKLQHFQVIKSIHNGWSKNLDHQLF